MGISIISIYSLTVENQYCKYNSLIINLLIFVIRTLHCILELYLSFFTIKVLFKTICSSNVHKMAL